MEATVKLKLKFSVKNVRFISPYFGRYDVHVGVRFWGLILGYLRK